MLTESIEKPFLSICLGLNRILIRLFADLLSKVHHLCRVHYCWI